MTKSKKGGAWEREICKRLSLWWTEGADDSWLWRSSQSGGRATTRRKQNKSTHGHHGDIAATHPKAAPLTRIFTIELKRGYNRATIFDVLDKKQTSALQTFEKFIEQSRLAACSAGSESWLLLTRRDQRSTVIWMEFAIRERLRKFGAFRLPMTTELRITANFRFPRADNKGMGFSRRTVVGMEFEDWLESVPPSAIRKLDKRIRNGR